MSDWDKTQEEKTCWRKEPESHGRWVSKGGLRDRCGRRPEIWRRWGSLAELGVGWQGEQGASAQGRARPSLGGCGLESLGATRDSCGVGGGLRKRRCPKPRRGFGFCAEQAGGWDVPAQEGQDLSKVLSPPGPRMATHCGGEGEGSESQEKATQWAGYGGAGQGGGQGDGTRGQSRKKGWQQEKRVSTQGLCFG